MSAAPIVPPQEKAVHLERRRLYYAANKQHWREYFQKHKARLTVEKKARRAKNIVAYRETDRLREVRKRQSKTSWRHRNPEKAQAKARQYYASHPEYRKKVIANSAKRRKERADDIKRWHVAKMESDRNYKMRIILRKSVCRTLRRNNAPRIVASLNLFGCDVAFLRRHIESLFWPGMSWENYGRGNDKWQIDHIRPCASFDLTSLEQQKACFHWKNLQPLWGIDNNLKNDEVLAYV